MPSSAHIQQRLAEAARYALLRRLAPALRHNMAGSLQPISMIAAMMERRLQKPDPDMEALGKNSSAISTLSREAATECMSLMTWLAPKDNNLVAVGAGIEDALGLLSTELSFRGFTLVNETGGADAQVPRSVIRTVFMAALVGLTDASAGPAHVQLGASQAGGKVTLTLEVKPVDGEAITGGTPAYRSLEWDDVECLAEAESVEVKRSGHRLELRCAAGTQPPAETV
jgi:hypothetical protein